MITFIRWYLAKAKAMKLKLAFYSFLEDGLKYITENKDDFARKLMQENGTEAPEKKITA